MNAYGVNLKLKNREALNVLLSNLKDVEVDCETATASLDSLMSKIASLREISPTDAQRCTPEEVGIELGALIDAGSDAANEVDKFRNEIVTLGQDAVKLYASTDNGIEVDPVMQKILAVFNAFKSLYTPVVKGCSLEIEELEDDILGHEHRVLIFLQAVHSSNLNVNLGFHSDYMHSLIAPGHLHSQCLHSIREYKMHTSRLSAEASEANHRILRNFLNRLQGFSDRAVGNLQQWNVFWQCNL
jgi:hypothetical protein